MTAAGPVGPLKSRALLARLFSSRGGNPRSLRISTAASVSTGLLFFLLFSFFLLRPRISAKNFASGSPRNDDSELGRPVVSLIFSPLHGSHDSAREIACSSGPFLGHAGFQAWPIGLPFDHQIIGVAGEAIDGALRPDWIGKRGQPFVRAAIRSHDHRADAITL